MPSSDLWLAAGVGIALLAAPAAACSPPYLPPPPMLPGETEEVYRVRIEAQARRDQERARVQAEAAQLAREDQLWRTADRIVLAEVVRLSGWRKDRRGAQYRVATLRLHSEARGPRVPRRLKLRSYDGGDACFGPQGPVYPIEGSLVLFARSGTLSDATVIDWSSAALSTHPQTLALLEETEAARD
ncbi:hypothetical protein [Erythrobacter donghaensis]|uniref:hypothetical protein n=1 Tax=Erythrobacter donghaensis TaxID=267135 RepID=UPI00117F716B|nr:hypothetical protein [Erythrobacter donghaensis]